MRRCRTRRQAQLEQALKGRIIPVLHGDIIFDEEQGFRILSGDQVVVYAAKEVAKVFGARAVKVGVGSDVDGVLSGGREGEGEVVRELTPADAERERKRKSIKGSGSLAEIEFEVKGKSGETSELDISNGLLVDAEAREIVANWHDDEVTVEHEIPSVIKRGISWASATSRSEVKIFYPLPQ
ncbi:MAG: hypothetical protein C4B55_04570 [Candidatus Methanophagaceae archaeon]|nr:MAG: hypothetical protein C4B55_04570 [Methanophagales archaeon]